MFAALDRALFWEGIGSKDYKLEGGKWKGESEDGAAFAMATAGQGAEVGD